MSNSELQNALERKRKQCEEEGLSFVRERDPLSSTADVSFNERLASQFTPRHPFEAPAPAARSALPPEIQAAQFVSGSTTKEAADKPYETNAMPKSNDLSHWDALSETVPHDPDGSAQPRVEAVFNEGQNKPAESPPGSGWYEPDVSFCVDRNEFLRQDERDSQEPSSSREPSLAFNEGNDRKLNEGDACEQGVTFNEGGTREPSFAFNDGPKIERVFSEGPKSTAQSSYLINTEEFQVEDFQGGSAPGPLDMSQWTCAGRSSFGFGPDSVRCSLDIDEPVNARAPTGPPAMPPLALGPLSRPADERLMSGSNSPNVVVVSPTDTQVDFGGTWLGNQEVMDGGPKASPRTTDSQVSDSLADSWLFKQAAQQQGNDSQKIPANPRNISDFSSLVKSEADSTSTSLSSPRKQSPRKHTTPRDYADSQSTTSGFGALLSSGSREPEPNSRPVVVPAESLEVSASKGLSLMETREVDLSGTWLGSIVSGEPQPQTTLPPQTVENRLGSHANSKPEMRSDGGKNSMNIAPDHTLLEPAPQLVGGPESPAQRAAGTTPVASGLLHPIGDNQGSSGYFGNNAADPLAFTFVSGDFLAQSSAVASAPGNAVASAPGSRLPDPPPLMDPLVMSMSSSNYFRDPNFNKKMPPPAANCPTPAKPAGGGSLASTAGPDRPTLFPSQRDAMMMQKIEALKVGVAGLRNEVIAICNGQAVRPAELRRILQDADELYERSGFCEEELLHIPEWPGAQLKQLRRAEEGLSSWEKTTERTQELVAAAEGTIPLAQIVEQLRQLLAAWDLLTHEANGQVNFGVSLEKRAQLAAPMASVLLDKATLVAKSDPNTVPARWLERLLTDEAAKKAFDSLGVSLPTPQTMRDLQENQGPSESAPRNPAAGAIKPGARPSGPKQLWDAIVQGDLPVVDSFIQQGGLVSGRTVDAQGHSVLWDAVAFQQDEIALSIFRHFPPDDSARGVDLTEIHQSRGDTLLHLCCYFTRFTRRTAELFTAIFKSSKSEVHRAKNAQKETFVHLAAQRLNFWVLQFVLTQNMEDLYLVLDARGYSPLAYIESSLQKQHGALQPPFVPIGAEDRVPAWSNLCLLRPSGRGAVVAHFADIAVQVQDADAGKTSLYAHRVVLAASSPELHSKLPRSAFGADGMHALIIDPECCQSAEVVLTALKFLYDGEVKCGFEGNGHLLWQLLCLCVKYQLPLPLRRYASASLLNVLSHKRSAPVVGVLLRSARQVGLQPREQHFVARTFLCSPHALLAVEEAKRNKTLKHVLAIVEELVTGK